MWQLLLNSMTLNSHGSQFKLFPSVEFFAVDKRVEGEGGRGCDCAERGHGVDRMRNDRVRPIGWCGRWDSNPHDVAIEGF
jgi:hypothetical protein